MRRVYGITLLAIIATLVADAITPIGFEIWFLYLLPVTMALTRERPWLPIWIAALSTAGIVAGYFLSRAANSALFTWTELGNRAVAVAALWLVAFQLTLEIRAMNAELEQRVLESLGVLAGGIAHDFNNILAGISTATRRASHLTWQMLAYSDGATARPIDRTEMPIDLHQEGGGTALRWVSVLGTAVVLTGCSTLFDLSGGYAKSLRTTETDTFAFHANAGMGPEGGGLGASLRARVGDVSGGSTGLHVYQLAPHGVVTLFGRAGLTLLQYERLAIGGQHRGAFGMFSPIADVGLILGGPCGVALTLSYEYTVRFSSVPNDNYVMMLMGFGCGGTSK
ncbi:MAG: hypothetical protein WCI05_18140 [Myxococcales bacterium]